MLEAVKKLFDRKQKPPYQAGTNLLLLLVLSVVIGSGVSYATLGFMKAFDHVVNWVYFDWNDSPSGRYTHKVDARNKLSLDFRGNNKHNLDSLKQTEWPTAGDCILITTRNGVRQTPVTGQWKFENNQVRVDIDGQPIELKFDGKNLTPIAADANATQLATHLPGPEPTHAIRFDYKQGSFTDVPKWHILAALIGGGLFIGLLYVAFKLPRGHGPADAIIARITNDGIMPFREGISTAIVCISSIGLGASVGRYGPAVHLGATLGSGFGQAFKLGRTNTVTFLGCGIASAIATSFNTPIAAVIFTHEAIIGHYSLRAFAPITIAAVAGNAVAIHHGRFFDGFQNLTAPAELTLSQYPLFAIVGLISAFFALIYMRGIVAMGKAVKKTKVPLWLRPALAGLAIGLVAIWLPNSGETCFFFFSTHAHFDRWQNLIIF